jgi:hypothetical protein
MNNWSRPEVVHRDCGHPADPYLACAPGRGGIGREPRVRHAHLLHQRPPPPRRVRHRSLSRVVSAAAAVPRQAGGVLALTCLAGCGPSSRSGSARSRGRPDVAARCRASADRRGGSPTRKSPSGAATLCAGVDRSSRSASAGQGRAVRLLRGLPARSAGVRARAGPGARHRRRRSASRELQLCGRPRCRRGRALETCAREGPRRSPLGRAQVALPPRAGRRVRTARAV